MKNILIYIVSLFLFFSCSTNRYRKKSSDFLRIEKGEIKQVSKIAEYEVETFKVYSTYTGDYVKEKHNQSVLLAKELAIGKAIMKAKCDFLVNPIYDIQVNNKKIIVKVEGYPANYISFTTQTKKDTVFIENTVKIPTSLDVLTAKKNKLTSKKKHKVRKKRVKKHPSNNFYLVYGGNTPIGKLGKDISVKSDFYNKGYGGQKTGYYYSIGFKRFIPNRKLGNFDIGMDYALNYSTLESIVSSSESSSLELSFGPSLCYKLNKNNRVDISFVLLPSIGNISNEFYGLTVDKDLLFSFRSGIKLDYRINKFLIGTSLSMGKVKMDATDFSSINNTYEASTTQFKLYFGFAF